ncbi:MAG: Ig-like domain-containing protein [Solirubrobacteraceae bacterium]
MSVAWAGVGLSIVPDLPSPNGPVVVGQMNIPSKLTITNQSNGAEAGLNFTLTQPITLVPSCGVQTVSGDCPVANRDPNVFLVGSVAVGAAGTACADTTFATSLLDVSQGKYQFSPSAPVVLGARGAGALSPAGATCVIDYTVNVLRAPAKDASAITPGVQTEQLGSAGGSATDNVQGGGVGSNETTVNQGTVPIATQVAPTPLPVGGSFRDTATLAPPAGAVTPTGSVTFNVYGPDDPACTSSPAFSSTSPLNSAGTAAVSSSFTPTGAGAYRVVASYGGDANYSASTSACGDPAEVATVTPAPTPTPTPTPATAPPAPIPPLPAQPLTPARVAQTVVPKPAPKHKPKKRKHHKPRRAHRHHGFTG